MKKPKIVIAFFRPITKAAGTTLCKQAKYINRLYKDTHDFILIMPRVVTPALSNLVIATSGIIPSRIIYTAKRYKEDVESRKYNNWREFFRGEDWFKELDCVEKIFLFGGMLSSSSGICRKKNKFATILDTRGFMHFRSIGHYMAPLLQMMKLAKNSGAEFNEICYDPDENSVGSFNDAECSPDKYNLYFYYDIPRYGMKRLDCFHDELLELKSDEKTIDFVFGGSFVTDSRFMIYEKAENLINNFFENKKLFIKHKKIGVNDEIPYAQYLEEIARARFTLLIPAYDVTTFSILRFAESLAQGCLPLITEDVVTNEFVQSYGIDPKMVEELRIPYDAMYAARTYHMTEAKRKKLLNYFYKKVILAGG